MRRRRAAVVPLGVSRDVYMAVGAPTPTTPMHMPMNVAMDGGMAVSTARAMAAAVVVVVVAAVVAAAAVVLVAAVVAAAIAVVLDMVVSPDADSSATAIVAAWATVLQLLVHHWSSLVLRVINHAPPMNTTAVIAASGAKIRATLIPLDGSLGCLC